MDYILKNCIDFGKISNYVQSKDGSLNSIVLSYYADLGLNFGIETEKGMKAKLENSDIGAIDLCWKDAGRVLAAFQVQFGNYQEIISSCFLLKTAGAEYSFLVISTKNRGITFDTAGKIFMDIMKCGKGKTSALIDIHGEKTSIVQG